MSVFAIYPRDRVKQALHAIGAWLADGGLPVLGRNRGRHVSEIPTTAFRRAGHSLEVVRDIMSGSEERDLALGLKLPYRTQTWILVVVATRGDDGVESSPRS